MNIRAFSMIFAAYSNPNALPEYFEGASYWWWYFAQIFFDLKMMSIFSMLFGAGVVLMTTREEARTGRSAGLHYKRMGWLLVIGLIHSYLIWLGDILVGYALSGMILYLFRKLRPAFLIVLSVIFLSVGSLLSLGFAGKMNIVSAQIEAFYAEQEDVDNTTPDANTDELTPDPDEAPRSRRRRRGHPPHRRCRDRSGRRERHEHRRANGRRGFLGTAREPPELAEHDRPDAEHVASERRDA